MKHFILEAIKLATKTGSLFADPEFPASDSSLYNNPLITPIYSNH